LPAAELDASTTDFDSVLLRPRVAREGIVVSTKGLVPRRGMGSVAYTYRFIEGSKLARRALSRCRTIVRKPTLAFNLHWRSAMKRVGFKLAMVVGLLALAACGETTGDRGLTGAGIGAAVGAGVGPATGALTTPSTVDLGKPVWER
jgi:osmotically inducible lipoprotein OsmB